jgi:hypothetical protein
VAGTCDKARGEVAEEPSPGEAFAAFGRETRELRAETTWSSVGPTKGQSLTRAAARADGVESGRVIATS